MSFLGDLYNRAKKKLYDWEQPIQKSVSSGLGQAYNDAKDYLGNVGNKVSNTSHEIGDYFSQPERVAKDVFLNTSAFGAADKLMNDWRSPVADYFKPTEQARTRDLVREAPQATWEAAKQIPQFATRFAISAVEAPKAIRTSQATKKYYNTPFGRLNSFQSEAQNRVERGDPLWKSIAYPAAKTVLGAADAMAAAKPILGAAKSLSKFGRVGKEVSNIADDLTIPLGKTMKKTIPARVENVSPDIYDSQPGIGTFEIGKNGAEKVSGFKMTRETKPTLIPETTVDVPFEFKSKTLRSAQNPGLTIKDISPEAAARRAAYNERQAASAEKAKQLVAKQMENQRQGLETAEPGFVSPKVLKAPEVLRPTRDQISRQLTAVQPTAPAKTPLPSIEEFVNGKTEAPKTIQMPDDIKALQDKVDNGEFIQPQLYKKLMAWQENPKASNPVFSNENPFTDNHFIEMNRLFSKPSLTSEESARAIDLEKRFGALPEVQKARYFNINMDEALNNNPMSDSMGNQYDQFTSLFKDARLRNPGVKDKLINGDAESFRNELVNRGIMKPAEVDNMLYSQDQGVHDVFDLFKNRLQKENPDLLVGKKAGGIFDKAGNEVPFRGDEFSMPNEGKPYNAFQEKAYQAKQERIGEIRNIAEFPPELRAGGFRKAEIERMGIDEAKKKANLLKLGYPKDEILKMDFDRMDLILKRGVPHETLKNYYQRKHALDTNYLEGVDPNTLKDINPLMTGNRDVYRNFEAAFGQNFPKIKSQLLDPFDAAKGNMINEQKQLLQEVLDNVVNKLGIKKGSELDHAVVAYGEGKIKLPELQELYPNDWKKITAADEWFRNKYPQLLDDLNAVREENFPTHPLFPESTKIIPQRADYYRHGKDLEGFAGLRNMFEGSGSIDPALAATSDVTNPKTKWLSFAQRRKGDENDLGAVQGYLDYIKNHSYAKHIDPFIQKFKGVDEEAKQLAPSNGFFHETRGLSEELSKKLDPVQQIADSTDPSEIKNILVDKGVSDLQANWMSKELANIHDLEKARTFLKDKLAKNTGKQLENLNNAIAPAERGQNKENNFLVFIKNFSRNLAGKTNTMDRPVQENIFGRKAFGILNWANSRIKANVILGKTSSSLAQFFNVPQGFASAGAQNSAKGLGDSLAGIFRENAPMKQSAFINERTFSGFNKFDTGILANTKKFAIWMLGVGDEIGTKFIWNSHYRKALSEGIPNPIKYADDWSRKMVGGRGIGEMPMVQQSKIVQMIAPFQYEVNNMWFALRDIVKNDPRKLVVAKKMIEFAAASFVMNRIVKEIRGSDVSFDPINAALEAYGEYQNEDNKVTGAVKAGGRLAGEALSNVMGGQTLASFYPEFGYGLNKENFPTASKFLNNPRKDFFGEGDPTRFGTGSSFLMGTAFKNPLTGFVLPYGGKQLEATYGGVKTLLKGYAENASGKIMTPVNRGVANVMKGVLFGKNALNEVRDYYDNNGAPLSDLQTEKYKLMGNDPNYFNLIATDRKANQEKDALKGGKAPGEAKNLSDDMSQLSNGKIYVKSLDKEFRNEKEASTAISIDGFLGSDKKYMELDGKFYYKNPNTVSGYSATTVAARDKSLASSSSNLEMDRAKDNKDLKAWAVAADKKLQSIDTYLQTLDPAIDQDEIDSLTLEKENLIDTAKKYAGYGGFTKGSSGGSSASKALTLSSAKLTTLKAKGDYKGWMAAAGSQLDMLQNQANNPNLSELQRTRAESKIATLEKQYSTYKEQGGFTKPKAAKVAALGDEKWRYPLVDPQMLKIQALIAGTGSKAPIIGKRALPLIARRLPVVHRASRRRKR